MKFKDFGNTGTDTLTISGGSGGIYIKDTSNNNLMYQGENLLDKENNKINVNLEDEIIEKTLIK